MQNIRGSYLFETSFKFYMRFLKSNDISIDGLHRRPLVRIYNLRYHTRNRNSR